VSFQVVHIDLDFVDTAQIQNFDVVQCCGFVAPSQNLYTLFVVVEVDRVALAGVVQRQKLEPLVDEHILDVAHVGDLAARLAARGEQQSILAHTLDLAVPKPHGVAQGLQLLRRQPEDAVLADGHRLVLEGLRIVSVPLFEAFRVLDPIRVFSAAQHVDEVVRGQAAHTVELVLPVKLVEHE